MTSKPFIIIAQVFLIKIISGQCLPNPEIMAPQLHPDGIAVSDGLGIAPNIALNPNLSANHIPVGPNIPVNSLALGPNIGLPNYANNLAVANSWPVAPNRLGFGGIGSISPAAMAPSMGIAACNGGGFTVTSSSPIAPTGITVTSENTIEGALLVSGQLPFLGTVAMDGAFPTAGGGSVSYGCGNGNIGIVNEGIPATAAAPILAPNVGFGSPIAGQFNNVPGRGYGLY